MSKQSPNHLISRLEFSDGRTRGWMVRLIRRGEAIRTMFSDSQHGGKTKALAAARAYRDEIEREIPTWTRRELAQQLRARNTSGIAGVSRRVKKARRGEKVYEYEVWTASGSPSPGQRKVRDFPVSVWGKDAMEMAIEQRLRWEAEMDESAK